MIFLSFWIVLKGISKACEFTISKQKQCICHNTIYCYTLSIILELKPDKCDFSLKSIFSFFWKSNAAFSWFQDDSKDCFNLRVHPLKSTTCLIVHGTGCLSMFSIRLFGSLLLVYMFYYFITQLQLKQKQ